MAESLVGVRVVLSVSHLVGQLAKKLELLEAGLKEFGLVVRLAGL